MQDDDQQPGEGAGEGFLLSSHFFCPFDVKKEKCDMYCALWTKEGCALKCLHYDIENLTEAVKDFKKVLEKAHLNIVMENPMK